MKEQKVRNISDIINYLKELTIDDNTQLAFRGEKEDFSKNKINTALTPSIYRDGYIHHEEYIYREMQRFNDNEFIYDRTAFDRLSRMQHYSAPTRLLDISEDLMSAIYFAIDNKVVTKDAIIYIFEINKNEIKYYDSDSVSVVSNIAKIPLQSRANEKSKKSLICDVNKYKSHRKKFNKQKSVKFLRHEIREEKPQFEAIIDPNDLMSIQCVRPKLTNNRLKSQKGVFFLFGLNPDNPNKSIELIKNNKLLNDARIKHPIKKIHKLIINSCSVEEIQIELKKIGVTKAFIYPEMDKVAEFIKDTKND